MDTLVNYELQDGIATLTLNNGKANALSPAMLVALNEALDRSDSDRAAVVLTGREGMFSGGFDLAVMGAGGPPTRELVIGGFLLAERLLKFPRPVVIAAGGHALAMASFLLLCGDLRLGAEGAFKIGANEVAIGLTMPYAATEICRMRLAVTHFGRAVTNAEIFTPAAAVDAGFLDRVVPQEQLLAEARAAAAGLFKLNRAAFAATKLRARAPGLTALRAAIEADEAEFRKMFG
ncbi:crotonase/enoyl-CoA hydratase family protein [Solimonas sp. K1W22B-7]|uniref:crotonase/enoyl-CoA hydratase family protein n=1 Tax=Solimonas sp. K1W22B-7 TaxID=2303331 RepID=UPI000E331298|nr:crotonase/enoyl-CoA hydratase family protein [Solimonas sp. K1W22B-7]AXQ30242.1 crotonase/enoyl-CoA hydratase family protein [Solimonas sp. K1W22B-7]